MKYKGSCHCGEVKFSVEGELTQVMECNCSHCSRKSLLWFVARDKFRLNSGEDKLATYTFNKHVIKHHFCPACGCAPFGFGKDPKGTDTVAVNVRCLEGLELDTLARLKVDGRNF